MIQSEIPESEIKSEQDQPSKGMLHKQAIKTELSINYLGKSSNRHLYRCEGATSLCKY